VDGSVLNAILVMSSIGVGAAIILFFVAQKFKVIEDPKIDLVDEALPGANCGGCGYAGCRAFAEGMVKAETMDGFFCPVGGNDLMKSLAPLLGVEAVEKKPQIAVLRCNGSIKNSIPKFDYDGDSTCSFTTNLSAGVGGCQYGCLGGGECVDACDFDAMYMDPETNLPVVKINCVACNACVEACPRDILELRDRGPKEKRIFVSCINEEKGPLAKANCTVACIGCKACVKACKFDAIDFDNFLAYIKYDVCTLCRKCVEVCPTDAIHELNFKPRKPKADKPKVAKPKVEKSAADKPKEEKEESKTEEKVADNKEKSEKTASDVKVESTNNDKN